MGEHACRRIYIYRILYRNRCLLLRGPADAATFSAGRFGVLAPFLRSPSLSRSLSRSLAPSRFIFPPLPPSFGGFFLFGKRFSPFLPRDRTLTLRRRSRGVENTGSTTRRDETDVSRSFLSIARTVTFRLRDTPPFSSRPPPPPHSIESFSNQFELIPLSFFFSIRKILGYFPNRKHLANDDQTFHYSRRIDRYDNLYVILFFSIVRVQPFDDLGSRIPKCLVVSLAIEEREREGEGVGRRRSKAVRFRKGEWVGGLVLAGY